MGRCGSKGWPGGYTPPWELCTPVPLPSNETGWKEARLHNTCIYSVTSYSWCQITSYHSLNHVLCHPEFLPPPNIYKSGHPAGHPKLLQLETSLAVACVCFSFFFIFFVSGYVCWITKLITLIFLFDVKFSYRIVSYRMCIVSLYSSVIGRGLEILVLSRHCSLDVCNAFGERLPHRHLLHRCHCWEYTCTAGG